MKTIYSIDKDIKKNLACNNSLIFKLGEYYACKDFDMVFAAIGDLESQLRQLKNDIAWIENRVDTDTLN